MTPASNLREIVNGLWFWSSLHQEWKVDFSSCAWKGKEGLVLIDPIELDPASLARLEEVGVAHGNPVHPQAHEQFAKLFSA